jgi:di/tricarboxylate transporter
METQLIITFVILIIALVLFLTEKLPADVVALLVAVSLGVTGVLTPDETFSGFSRTAVITIVAIFVLTEALQRTGVTEQVGKILQKVGGQSELRLVLAVMIAGAFLSLFMNNIAAAAVLLPAASGASKKSGVNNSRLLLPLAFGTILGGMATLLTTSNIVVNSVLHDSNIEGFSLYEFAPVGLPMAVAGILYVALIGRLQLPGESPIERTMAPNRDEQSDLVAAYHLDENLFRARVPQNSSLIDKTLSESHLREDFGVSVVAIERNDKRLFALSPETEIKDGDTLVLEGDEADFRRRDVQPYMEFLPQSEWHKSDLESKAVEVVEAMLTPRSRLVGETLRSAHFREKYGMTVLAIWRGENEVIADLPDIPLEFGDALLLQGTREKLAVLSQDADLILLMTKEESAITVPTKGRAALMIFVATLVFAIILPDLTAAIMLGGALSMVLVGILTTQQAYASISWKTIFLVAGMLPMGIALAKTPAAAIMGSWVVTTLGAYGGFGLMAGLFLITMLMVQTVSGAVVAAVVAPVAIKVAQQTGVDPRALAMAVAIATSMAFITPLGHAVNILVMSPGGYSFRDYVKVGAPLTLILFIVAMIVMPLMWRL